MQKSSERASEANGLLWGPACDFFAAMQSCHVLLGPLASFWKRLPTAAPPPACSSNGVDAAKGIPSLLGCVRAHEHIYPNGS